MSDGIHAPERAMIRLEGALQIISRCGRRIVRQQPFESAGPSCPGIRRRLLSVVMEDGRSVLIALMALRKKRYAALASGDRTA